eukprot:m.255922 g.255922  ORF g.255922 m.255922 type:complete len:323 (-) comp19166_c2_seq9:201-1169(-)
MAAPTQLAASVSFLPGNLSARVVGDSVDFAYVHRHTARVAQATVKKGAAADAQFGEQNVIHSQGGGALEAVLQVSWVSLADGSADLLVVCTVAGVAFYNGPRLLLEHKLARDDKDMVFCRGACHVRGRHACIGTSFGGVLIFAIESDRVALERTEVEHQAALCALSAAPWDASADPVWRMASADENGAVVVWDADALRPLHIIPGESFPCTSLQLLDDRIAAGFANGCLRFFRISTRQKYAEVAAHARQILALALATGSDQSQLASVSEDSRIHVWRLLGDHVALKYSGTVPDCIPCGVVFCSTDVLAISCYDSKQLAFVAV